MAVSFPFRSAKSSLLTGYEDESVLSDNDFREALKRRGPSGKNKDPETVGNCDQNIWAQSLAKKRPELRRKHCRCRQGTCRLEHRALDDFVFIANEAGSEPGEHLGSSFRRRRQNCVSSRAEGENVVALQRKHFAVYVAGRHQNRPLGALDRPTRFVVHKGRLDEKMPYLVGCGMRHCCDDEKAESAFEFSHWSAREGEAMISFLEGVLEEALPTQIIVNVHGVGYHVMIPLSSFERLSEPGSPVKILTHLVVREDSHTLYGFGTLAERDLFRLLLNHVSGVGPKLGLAILSGMAVEVFKAAVVSNDTAAISRIKGVGKKTAERIVLELKDKVGVAAEWEAASAATAPSERDQAMHDAVLALISLGYKQVEAHKAIKQCLAEASGPLGADELVRMALKILA